MKEEELIERIKDQINLCEEEILSAKSFAKYNLTNGITDKSLGMHLIETGNSIKENARAIEFSNSILKK